MQPDPYARPPGYPDPYGRPPDPQGPPPGYPPGYPPQPSNTAAVGLVLVIMLVLLLAIVGSYFYVHDGGTSGSRTVNVSQGVLPHATPGRPA